MKVKPIDLVNIDKLDKQNYINNVNDFEYLKYMDFCERSWNWYEMVEYADLSKKNYIEQLYGIYFVDRLAGTIRLGNWRKKHKTIDLGILVFKQFNGKGLATKGISDISDYVFNNTDINKITAGIYTKNLPSVKAFLNAGYTIEGLQRDYGYSGESLDRYLVAKHKDGKG